MAYRSSSSELATTRAFFVVVFLLALAAPTLLNKSNVSSLSISFFLVLALGTSKSLSLLSSTISASESLSAYLLAAFLALLKGLSATLVLESCFFSVVFDSGFLVRAALESCFLSAVLEGSFFIAGFGLKSMFSLDLKMLATFFSSFFSLLSRLLY